MREVLVRAERVNRRYPGTGEVLLDVSFEIGPRETIALSGPSGSGKSTLLHLVGGIDDPSSGTIEWPALAHPIRPGPVALAFQGPSLLAPLSVRENVRDGSYGASVDPKTATTRKTRIRARPIRTLGDRGSRSRGRRPRRGAAGTAPGFPVPSSAAGAAPRPVLVLSAMVRPPAGCGGRGTRRRSPRSG